MKVEKIEILIQRGEFINSDEFKKIKSETLSAIEKVEWHEQGKFVINPTKKGNGVKRIKDNFIQSLKHSSWDTEVKIGLIEDVGAGPIDAVKKTDFGKFAIEWETGNISSSHRALNKMAVGLLQKTIIGGILVMPMRELAKFLTDRIGNFEELIPYFPMYKSMDVTGFLGIIGVTYDNVSNGAPLMSKGQDGNAKKMKVVEKIEKLLSEENITDPIEKEEILNSVNEDGIPFIKGSNPK